MWKKNMSSAFLSLQSQLLLVSLFSFNDWSCRLVLSGIQVTSAFQSNCINLYVRCIILQCAFPAPSLKRMIIRSSQCIHVERVTALTCHASMSSNERVYAYIIIFTFGGYFVAWKCVFILNYTTCKMFSQLEIVVYMCDDKFEWNICDWDISLLI